MFTKLYFTGLKSMDSSMIDFFSSGVVVVTVFTCCSSSSLDNEGVERDVADESISGLDIGLISVAVWLLSLLVVDGNRRTSSYWASSVFVVVVDWLEWRDDRAGG